MGPVKVASRTANFTHLRVISKKGEKMTEGQYSLMASVARTLIISEGANRGQMTVPSSVGRW